MSTETEPRWEIGARVVIATDHSWYVRGCVGTVCRIGSTPFRPVRVDFGNGQFDTFYADELVAAQ